MVLLRTTELIKNLHSCGVPNLDLLPLPINERASIDGKKKAEFVKQLHERTRQHIEKRTEQYATQANKGRKQVVF